MLHLVDTAISLTFAVSQALASAVVAGVRRVLFGHRTQLLPQLYYKEGPLNAHLLENCVTLSRVFCPPWWLENQHAQTIVPTFLPRVKLQYRREIVKLSDGGELALDWAKTGTEQLKVDSPVVFILPGLAGDAQGYKALALYAAKNGLRPVVFNKRGHGGLKLTTPKLQSFGDPSDFKYVIDFVGRQFPNAPLTAIGISAGSGLLASYLGEEKDDTPLVANVGISPGYDAFRLFHESLRPPYDFLLLHGVRRIVEQNKAVLGSKFDMTEPLAATSVMEMDEKLYCKIYGFRTIDEYWKANNPMRAIEEVRRPMLCISSRDDPVVPEPLIPFSMFTENDNVILAAMDRGGHCGFLEDGTLENWAEKTAVEYVLSVLDYQNKMKMTTTSSS